MNIIRGNPVCVKPDCTEDNPCFRCKVLSISIAAAATPNRRPGIADKDAQESQLSKDLPAYKRLRNDGLQPKNIDGSAELEKRVGSQFDIDLGRYVPKSEMPRVLEGQQWCRENGIGA